jgi:hypothetical protein
MAGLSTDTKSLKKSAYPNCNSYVDLKNSPRNRRKRKNDRPETAPNNHANETVGPTKKTRNSSSREKCLIELATQAGSIIMKYAIYNRAAQGYISTAAKRTISNDLTRPPRTAKAINNTKTIKKTDKTYKN